MALYLGSQNQGAWPLFLRAYSLDSSFVRALLYGSIALTNIQNFPLAGRLLQIANRRRETLNEYERALLDSRIGFVRGNTPGLMVAIRQAAQLAPGSKAVYNHAVAAYQNGYVREALEAIQTLQPDRGPMKGFTGYWAIYGAIVHALGDFDRELGISDGARTEFRDRLIPFVPRLRALAARDDVQGINATFAEVRRLPPDPYYWDYSRCDEHFAVELEAHGHGANARPFRLELLNWLMLRDTETPPLVGVACKHSTDCRTGTVRGSASRRCARRHPWISTNLG